MKTNQREIGTAWSKVENWRRYVRSGVPMMLSLGVSTAVFVGMQNSRGLLCMPPAWLKKLVVRRGESGGGKPFVQGWTHTGRRIRRFLQKPVAGVVVVSFLDIEPHELSRSSFSAGGWKGVFANGVES